MNKPPLLMNKLLFLSSKPVFFTFIRQTSTLVNENCIFVYNIFSSVKSAGNFGYY